MSKKPYFITADGVSVKGNDRVFCIGVLYSDPNKRVVFRDICKIAVRTVMEDQIFSTRATAQTFCDFKNQSYEY